MAQVGASILISAKDAASAVLKKVGSSISETGKAAQGASVGVGGLSRGLTDMLKFGGAVVAINQLGRAFQAVAAHSPVLQASLDNLSAQGTAAMKSFADNAGTGLSAFVDSISSGIGKATELFGRFSKNLAAVGQWWGARLAGDSITFGDALKQAGELAEETAKKNEALAASLKATAEANALATEKSKNWAAQQKAMQDAAERAERSIADMNTELAAMRAVLEGGEGADAEIRLKAEVDVFARSLGEFANTEKGKTKIKEFETARRDMLDTATAIKEKKLNNERIATSAETLDELLRRNREFFFTKEELALAELEREKEAMREKLALDGITKEEELALEQWFQNEKTAIEENAAAERAEQERIREEQRRQMMLDNLTFTQELALQGVDMVVQGTGQMIAGAILHGESMMEMSKNLLKSIASMVIASLANMASQFIRNALVFRMAKKQEGASAQSANLPAVYSGAFASIAAIPIVGPALAPGIASAALSTAIAGSAAAAALGATTGAAMVGKTGGFVPMLPGADPNADSVMAFLQPGELIIPKPFAQEFAERRQGGGFVGEAESFSPPASGSVNATFIAADPTRMGELLSAINTAVERFGFTLVASEVRS